MSFFKNETALVSRYALAGALNTVVGLTILFGLTHLGVSPILSNMAGYGIGLIFGFFSARSFVFRSDGEIIKESRNYLASFLVSYAVNIGALILSIRVLSLDEFFSQIIAVAFYVITMFACSRWYVFRGNR